MKWLDNSLSNKLRLLYVSAWNERPFPSFGTLKWRFPIAPHNKQVRATKSVESLTTNKWRHKNIICEFLWHREAIECLSVMMRKSVFTTREKNSDEVCFIMSWRFKWSNDDRKKLMKFSVNEWISDYLVRAERFIRGGFYRWS